jgi:hypothetical protein
MSTDPVSTVSTDVRDVQNRIVRFTSQNTSAADGRMFAEYPVSGYFIRGDRAFQVRFGTVGSERLAYFTETGRRTICDVVVAGSNLSCRRTPVLNHHQLSRWCSPIQLRRPLRPPMSARQGNRASTSRAGR